MFVVVSIIAVAVVNCVLVYQKRLILILSYLILCQCVWIFCDNLCLYLDKPIQDLFKVVGAEI